MRIIKKKKSNSSHRMSLILNRWISPFASMTHSRKPGSGFITNVLDNKRIVDEFTVSKTPVLTLVDSNIVSADITVPLPSNDDSLKSVTFFLYIITKNIFIAKFNSMIKWKYSANLATNKKYLIKKLMFFEVIDQRLVFRKKEDKLNFNIINLFNEISELGLSKYDISNEIKYRLISKFELIYIPYRNTDKLVTTFNF